MESISPDSNKDYGYMYKGNYDFQHFLPASVRKFIGSIFTNAHQQRFQQWRNDSSHTRDWFFNVACKSSYPLRCQAFSSHKAIFEYISTTNNDYSHASCFRRVVCYVTENFGPLIENAFYKKLQKCKWDLNWTIYYVLKVHWTAIGCEHERVNYYKFFSTLCPNKNSFSMLKNRPYRLLLISGLTLLKTLIG